MIDSMLFSLCINKQKETVKCVDTRLDVESGHVLPERPPSFLGMKTNDEYRIRSLMLAEFGGKGER